jgi:hypothetical protein
MSQTREERIAAKRAALRNARAQESKGYDSPYTRDLQSFKPAEGKNRIRLMGVPGETNHSVTIHVHYGVGADRASYLCLNHNDDSITGGKGECPICAEQLKASLAASRMPEGAAKEEAKKEANGLRAKPRRFTLLVDRSKPEEGLKFWSMPASIDANIVDQMDDVDTGEFRMVDDPYEGHDVAFKRDGQGINTKYTGEQIAPKPTPLSTNDTQMKAWLDEFEGYSMQQLLVAYPASHIARVMGISGFDNDPTPTSAHDGVVPKSSQPAPAPVEEPQVVVEPGDGAPTANVEDIFGADNADLDWD